MRRDRNSAVHSFEMFLDIICNAFGGIIFIALLLCIMLQISGGALTVAEESQAQKLKDNSAEIERLSKLLEIQNQQLESIHKNSDDEKLEEYLDLQKQLKDRQQLLRKAQQQADMLSQNRNQLNKLLAAEKLTNQKLQDQFQQIEIHTRDPMASFTLSVPREQKTTLKPINMLLRNGKLALLNRYNSTGQAVGRNTKEVLITSSGSQTLARPKNEMGKLIPASGGNGGQGREKLIGNTVDAITPMLGKFQPQPQSSGHKYYMNIAVWADSFEQFETLRDALIQMGFEYNFVPVEQDKSIPIKTTGQRVVQ